MQYANLMVFYMQTLLLFMELVPLLYLLLVFVFLVEIWNLQGKYGVLLMVTQVTLIIENFIVILAMRLIMTI